MLRFFVRVLVFGGALLLSLHTGCQPREPQPRRSLARAAVGLAPAMPAGVNVGGIEASDLPTRVDPPPPPILTASADDDEADAGVDQAPPPPLVHPAGNDLTFPCRSDADCNFGACFISGRGLEANPICSKRCASEADCPDGALCTQPLECDARASACAEPGYCFRACAADAECTAFNALGTEPNADPELVNPVACISWAPTLDFLDPRAGLPPIDICIQRSEP